MLRLSLARCLAPPQQHRHGLCRAFAAAAAARSRGGGSRRPRRPEPNTASGVLASSELLSPAEYARLDTLALDADDLPAKERRRSERQHAEGVQKQLRREMLADVQQTVRQVHGKNSRFVLSRLERAQGPWTPKKKVSRADMNRIRMLHKALPGKYSYDKLAYVFGISRAAVGRIIRSRFVPDADTEKKQARQKNRVDVAGLLGAAGERGSLPLPKPAPPPPELEAKAVGRPTDEGAGLPPLAGAAPQQLPPPEAKGEGTGAARRIREKKQTRHKRRRKSKPKGKRGG